jgi:DNA-directed RNA polymerase subunit RPC12/RpoP
MAIARGGYDDDDEDERGESGQRSRFREFDCPSCGANNPSGDSFGDRDEIVCNYCGTEYRVQVTEEGRLKLKEL